MRISAAAATAAKPPDRCTTERREARWRRRAWSGLAAVAVVLLSASPAWAGHGNSAPEVAATPSQSDAACAANTGRVEFTNVGSTVEARAGSFNGSTYTLTLTPTVGGLAFELSTTGGPIVLARQVAVGRGSSWNVYNYHHPTPSFGPGVAHDDGLQGPSDTGAIHASFCVDQLFGSLPVQLYSFSATRSGRFSIVRWRTSSELDVLGFHVYAERKGKRIRLNRFLIPAKGSSGGSYLFRSRSRHAARATRFWLREITIDGTGSWQGAVRAGLTRRR